MNWVSYISHIKREDSKVTYRTSFTEDTSLIRQLKQRFNLIELPGAIEKLYGQTNSIYEVLNEEVFGELIWPIERVIETNQQFRSNKAFEDLYMSFDQLLFFADAGNGDCFAFVTLNGKFDINDVFVWNHEDDSRTWVAPDLKSFIEWWLSGKITV